MRLEPSILIVQKKRNAFNLEMWKTLIRLLDKVDKDSDIKVLVIRGVDHTSFVSGADISEFEEYKTGEETAEHYTKYTMKAFEILYNFRKPTIAMIQKYCIGAGCGIAVACDFRFTDTTGLFAITPSKIGLVYNLSATKQLVDLVGVANGKYILMSGEKINAQRAFEIGLVNDVFQPEEIEEKTYSFAEILCPELNSQFAV